MSLGLARPQVAQDSMKSGANDPLDRSTCNEFHLFPFENHGQWKQGVPWDLKTACPKPPHTFNDDPAVQKPRVCVS